MNFIFNKKIPLSITITRSLIYLVQIDKNKQIRFTTSLPTPEGAFVNDQIVNPHAIAEVIKKSLTEIHPKPKEVIFSIPDSLCFSKIFTLEKQTSTPATENILIDLAKTHIPVDFENTYWDYTKQKTTPDATTESYLYVCALRDVVEPYIMIAKECDLSVHAIDTTALALSRILIQTIKETETIQKDTATMILEGNTPTTSFAVFSMDNSLIYSGNIPFTDIQKYSENTVLQTITSELTKTITQIALTRHIQVNDILLTGELAAISNIEKTLVLDGVKIVCADPLSLFKTPSLLDRDTANAYSIALGLSLFYFYVEQKEPTIHLLSHKLPEKKNTPSIPSEIPEETKPNKKSKNILAYSFIILTFIGLGFVVYRYIVTPFLLA